MDKLGLKYWPDPILRVEATDWVGSNQEAMLIGTEMISIMHNHNGFGLSATQVGLDKRIFVMRDTESSTNGGLIFVNPIIKVSGRLVTDNEGCLSFPNLRGRVGRLWHVDITFIEPVTGRQLTQYFEGLNARCIQHEVDHLNGIMFFDHLRSNLIRKMLLEKHAKNMRKHARIY